MALGRHELATLLIETGAGLDKVNEALASKGFDHLTPEEAVQYGLTIPDGATTAIVAVPAVPEPDAVSAAVTLLDTLTGLPEVGSAGTPKGTMPCGILAPATKLGEHMGHGIGEEHVIFRKVCDAVSGIAQKVDPKGYEAYKNLKACANGRDKAKAYAWLFARLASLLYIPHE
jgi:hypothetical protein